MPTGFSTSYWGIIPNESYPYLLWQPTISGTVYATYGGTTLAGVTVSDVILDGSPDHHTVTSGANGTYTFLLNGSLPSGSNVVAYVFGSTNGVSYQQGAAGTVGGLNIYGTYLSETTAGTTASGLASGLATAIGGYPALQAEVAGLPNLAINATGANFTIDQTLNAGTLVLSSAGAVGRLGRPHGSESGARRVRDVLHADQRLQCDRHTGSQVGTATVSLADTVNLGIGSVTGASGVTGATLNLSFASGQGVTQSQPIAVSSLSLSGSGGTYTLTNSSNSIGALAASDATGTLSLYDTGAVTQSAAIFVGESRAPGFWRDLHVEQRVQQRRYAGGECRQRQLHRFHRPYDRNDRNHQRNHGDRRGGGDHDRRQQHYCHHRTNQ